MGSVLAYFNKAEDQSHYDIVRNAMIEMNYWEPDLSDTWYNDLLGMGCHVLVTSPSLASEKLPYWHEPSGCCIVADARIDYKEQLVANLEIDQEDAKAFTDSQLILKSYVKWKEKCTDHLFGDFSFIIWNDQTKELFSARDHFGTRPLYYLNHEEYFAISSDLKGFRAIPNFSFKVKELSLIKIMSLMIPDKDATPFEGVFRLDPATNLKFSASGDIKLDRYWDLEVSQEFNNLTETEAIQGLKEKFIDSIAQRSEAIRPIGIELSGGLDSSSVATCASNILSNNNKIVAFSHARSEIDLWQSNQFEDELYFSKQIAAALNINQYVLRGDGFSGSFSALISLLSEKLIPDIQFYATLSDLLLDKSNQLGINILLSGYGGDEGVTNSGIRVLGEYAKTNNYVKLKHEIRQRVIINGGKFYKKLLKQYVLILAPWILQILRKRRSRFRKTNLVDKKLVRKYDMIRRYSKYSTFPIIPDVRKSQYYRIMHPHVSDRLEASFFAALTKRIEYRYPFLDVKLLEFYYSLRSDVKFKNGVGRYVFREAMKGIIKEEVRMRPDKALATIPNAMTRLVQDESKYRDIISDGKKNNRFHYVDYNKMYEMIDVFKDKAKVKMAGIGFTPFVTSISVLVLQKWQREGKIDIGIKC